MSGPSNAASERRARPAPARNFLSPIWRQFCGAVLGLFGWKVKGDFPDESKAVLIAAPHTSNWDGVWMLAAAGFYQIKLRWMGKQALVKHPLGFVVRWLGCVPVDRKSASDVVDQMADAFHAADRMIFAVAPEGTRSHTSDWKSGFYRIAHKAGVPLVLSVLDYGTRTIRIDSVVHPTGDYETDLQLIQERYVSARGRHAGKFAVGED